MTNGEKKLDWAAAAVQALQTGRDCALISILAIEGSTPREVGARMLVDRHDCYGSIGGGNLEYQAIAQARASLDYPAGHWRIQDYPLGPLLNQCCGGRVRLLIEHLDAGQRDWIDMTRRTPGALLETTLGDAHLQRRLLTEGTTSALAARGPMPIAGESFAERLGVPPTPLLLLGAGHVAQALVRVIEGLNFALDWLDVRSACADLVGVTITDPAQLEEKARTAGGPVLVMTHDHDLDYRLVVAALAGSAAFVGLIGSASKRARFISRLTKASVTGPDLARLHCPIGLPGIVGKAPPVIAVAVAAQLLMLASARHEGM